MTTEQRQQITDNALAGSQFLASAILAGNKAALFTDPKDSAAQQREFEEHIECARAHYKATFEEVARANSLEWGADGTRTAYMVREPGGSWRHPTKNELSEHTPNAES